MVLPQLKARLATLPSTPGYSVVDGGRILFSGEDLLGLMARMRECPGSIELYRHSDGKLLAYRGSTRRKDSAEESE